MVRRRICRRLHLLLRLRRQLHERRAGRPRKAKVRIRRRTFTSRRPGPEQPVGQHSAEHPEAAGWIPRAGSCLSEAFVPVPQLHVDDDLLEARQHRVLQLDGALLHRAVGPRTRTLGHGCVKVTFKTFYYCTLQSFHIVD